MYGFVFKAAVSNKNDGKFLSHRLNLHLEYQKLFLSVIDVVLFKTTINITKYVSNSFKNIMVYLISFNYIFSLFLSQTCVYIGICFM